jgi:hypothetical protein
MAEYLNKRFDRNFRQLRDSLTDHLNNDHERIDDFLDRLPDMNVRLWKQKITMKPIKS